MLAVGLAAGAAVAALLAPAATAQALPPAPRPVYAPGIEAADPGVVRDGSDYYAFSTGGLGRVAYANTPQGPWTRLPDALSRWGDWASGNGAVWAPDAVRIGDHWVLYYSAQAKGFAGQRCIGTAVSAHPEGPYEPAVTPLICPQLDGQDPVAGRSDSTSGVIDPSPFQDRNGQRYLLYKTQKTPGTLRMYPLAPDGVNGAGEVSRELVRHSDSIEYPTMVQRGDYYVLFASANWYDQCRYSTVWLRSTDIWPFSDKTEHVLLNRAGTGLCGAGGADVVTTDRGPSRIFFHGWVCFEDNQPCQYDGLVTYPAKQRVVYAGVLTWGADGATPDVSALLPPVGR